MNAVIKTGGKQYLVKPGDKIEIEKVDNKAGEEIVFDRVLLLEDNEKLEIGTPLVEKAQVFGKVIRQDKDKKVTILKYKAKTRYKLKKGHRQPFTEIEILKIEH